MLREGKNKGGKKQSAGERSSSKKKDEKNAVKKNAECIEMKRERGPPEIASDSDETKRRKEASEETDLFPRDWDDESRYAHMRRGVVEEFLQVALYPVSGPRRKFIEKLSPLAYDSFQEPPLVIKQNHYLGANNFHHRYLFYHNTQAIEDHFVSSLLLDLDFDDFVLESGQEPQILH